MSYREGFRYNPNTDKLVLPSTYNGKLHYCGATLEEAVSKVRMVVASMEVNQTGTCTSMWIMRGREKGKNIKWKDYHKRGNAKEAWLESLKTMARFYAEQRRGR